MNKEGYTIFSQEPNLYSFISSGKNGEIVKAVAFVELLPNTFNLALLDYDSDTKSWSDVASTNNGDMPKVMVTVVAIIHDFLQSNPSSTVYFEANTSAKNNLYNRIVKNNYAFLSEFYEIRGKLNDESELYQLGKKYEGFYILKKQ